MSIDVKTFAVFGDGTKGFTPSNDIALTSESKFTISFKTLQKHKNCMPS